MIQEKLDSAQNSAAKLKDETKMQDDERSKKMRDI